MTKGILILSLAIVLLSCQSKIKDSEGQTIQTGAERMEEYLDNLKGKAIGLLVNQSSLVGQIHLLDTLIALGVDVRRIFAVEHGFRGDRDAGANIEDSRDAKTGLPIISLYGAKKQVSHEDLKDLDIVIFDMQDVGARFFTYISSMHYMMEACAEMNVKLIVLDRPNPNGHYVDGPVLNPSMKSFVGMHKIPIVHGMTVGELAKMIDNEGWLDSKATLDLQVIPVRNWNHQQPYSLPISPSPNLPNDRAIANYPSLCLFEGTNISVGRGTGFPFQAIGSPDSTFGVFTFTPVSMPGKSTYPKHEGKQCYGLDLRKSARPERLEIDYLLSFYKKAKNKQDFFNAYFKKLAGTETLQKQIEMDWTEVQIRASWQPELEKFKKLRKKYLLYGD